MQPTNPMPPDAFRTWAHAVVDWAVDYMQSVERHPVRAQVRPGDIRAALPPSPPRHGEPFDAILRDLDEKIMPGITHWQSPNFFAYFPANVSGPSILGELVSAVLGVQGMSWVTSPACTELETHVLDWLVEMLDLPERFSSRGDGGGVLQDTASSATLCALLAARERVTDGVSNATGINARLTAYTSTQAHSSVEKAMMIAGLGREHLRLIDVDERFAMRPDALDAAITADRADGRVPFFVCATVGTTSSNAMDPVDHIGARCRRYGLWLHVDAAMSGTAALCPEFRGMHAGLEAADSYCFNPHKWMFTNFDCDCFYVADRAALIRALSILPEYLVNEATTSGAVYDYRDWQVPLGRRFRALKLWFVIRSFGIDGLQAYVRHHVDLARRFADLVRADPRFELVVDPPLNLVCFRHRGGDAANQTIMDTLNEHGAIYITHTRLDGRLTLRFSIGQMQTEWRHVARAWALIAARAEAETTKPRSDGATEG